MGGAVLRYVCCAVAMLFGMAGSEASAAGRVAIVIGNSAYTHAPALKNAVQDARDVAAALRAIGFEVHDGYDLTRTQMLRLSAAVTSQLEKEDVALFYFSGHGIQIGAENFVLPVEATGDDSEALSDASVKLQSILYDMERRAGRNIVILDACRTNPFQSLLSGRSVGGATRGLARVDAGVGSYVAFSTQPGNIALDGDQENSPFTAALLAHIGSQDDDLHELMRKVRADVVASTRGAQIPWENSSMIEQVFLSQPGGRMHASSAAQVRPPTAESLRPRFSHIVFGLDPHGDGFLALRSGPTASSRLVARMTEGTRLVFVEQEGEWFHVRTDTGLVGWAHSNWIRFVGSASQHVNESPPASRSDADQCEELWYRRNAYFDKYGYCFRGARGQAVFSNAGCDPKVTASNAPLTSAERADVARLLAMEKSLGCP